MTTDKNNSIIKISSNELVQYKNKFKSIAIYNEETYESETIELINENNAGFGTLVLKADATENKKRLVLSPDWINGNAPIDVVYTWKALASDGYTDLIKNKDENISLDDEQNTLTIIDQTQLTSAITVTVIAYKQNIFVAQSAPYTVFEKAQGETGKDGSDIEYVYYRSKAEKPNLTAPTESDIQSQPSSVDDTMGDKWYPSPLGITDIWKYEYVSIRTKPAGINTNWTSFSTPVIWSKWGEKGQDGDGIKYKYCLINSATKPTYPAPASATYTWTDNPTGVSKNNQYEYVVSIITSPIVTVAKKIDTELREYDEEAWKKYGASGHEENWTIRGAGPFDNSHIHLQDYAYIEGTITDSNLTQPVKLYGRVIGLTQSSTSGGNVRMRSEFLMIGDQITSDVALWAKWGNDGRGIIEVVEWYQATSFDIEDDNNKLVDSDWNNNISDTSFGEDNKYLWNYEVIKYSSDPLEESTDPAVIATYSKDGDNGRGIQSIENYYQLRSDEDAPIAPLDSDIIDAPPVNEDPVVDTWYNAPVQTTVINKYLWNCEKITYDDGSAPTFTAPARIGTHGAPGPHGGSGPAGPGIESETRLYKWSENQPEGDEDGLEYSELLIYENYKNSGFLWMYYEQTWTDGRTPTYTTPIRMTDYEMGTLMASKENISISQWCEKYERTLIDGSTVATGGLIAETIQSGNYYNFGLKFEDYGSGYTAKLNSIVPEVVIVPAIYNNKPVLNIDITSFQQENAKNIIKKLAIPASVTTDLFGLLTGYTVLEELHIPIHKTKYNGNNPYFNNYFGNGSWQVEANSVPATLNKVYLSGTNDTTIVPLDYFDMLDYPEILKYDVYLTESISEMEAQEEHGAVNKIYRYGTPEIDDASIIVEQLSGAYSYPNTSNSENITGFRITSKEWEPMINSQNFKVTQDGTIYASNGEFTGKIHAQAGGDIAGWGIEENNISKKTNNTIVGLYSGDEATGPSLYQKKYSTNTIQVTRTLSVGTNTFIIPVDEYVINCKIIEYTIPAGYNFNYFACTATNEGNIQISYNMYATNSYTDVRDSLITIEYSYESGMLDSPIRFLGGGELINFKEDQIKEVVFNSDNAWLYSEESLDYKIDSITQITLEKTHELTGSITSNLQNIGTGGTGYLFNTTIKPEIPDDAILTHAVKNHSSSGSELTIKVVEPDRKEISVIGMATSANVDISISYTYQFSEELQTNIKINSDKNGYEITLNTHNQPIDYNISFRIKSIVPNFAVLEDGSFYAKAADISGKIETSEGVIGNWILDGNKLYSPKTSEEPGNGTGMAQHTFATSPVFWAGYGGYGDQPYDHKIYIEEQLKEQGKTEEEITEAIQNDPWWDHAKFSVDTQGYIRAKSGQIGAWNIDEKTGILYSLGDEIVKTETINGVTVNHRNGIALDPRSHEITKGARVFAIGTFPGTVSGDSWGDPGPAFSVTGNGKMTTRKCNIIDAQLESATIGNTLISADTEKNLASIVAQSGSFKIGGVNSCIIFKEDETSSQNDYQIQTVATQSGSENTWNFYMHCVDARGNLVKSPKTIGDEDLYFERYVDGEIVDEGYMGISLSLGAGQTTGPTSQKSFLTNWFLPDYIKVYNDSSKGSVITLKTDENDATTYALPYTSGKLYSEYYAECSSNLIPKSDDDYTIGSSVFPWKFGYFNALYCDQNYPQNYSSDERIKNSIEPLPEQYEVFFDKMEPTRYKYNDGTSNRYHTGFIAQQLVKSLEESGLTTQDFAGVMLNHPGEEDECWYLRRDEFVALNTWQIQKLKARVKQAEETIELQDTYIKKLEERIEKLEQKLL